MNGSLSCEFCVDEVAEKATGYCQNCDGYICKVCMDKHKQTKVFKEHVLLLLKNTSSGNQSFEHCYTEKRLGRPVDLIYQRCTAHACERILFYCEEHDKTRCGVCVTLNHKECKLIKALEVIEDKVFGSGDYLDCSSTLSELLRTVESLEEEIKRLRAMDNEMTKQCKETVLKFRQDINIKLDSLQFKVLHEIDAASNSNKQTLDKVDKTCKESKKTIEEYLRDMDNQESLKHRGKMYVLQKHILKQLPTTRATIKSARATVDRGIKLYHILPNSELVDILENIKSVGQLVEDVTGSAEFEG